MQVEEHTSSPSLEVIHDTQGNSKGQFGDAFVSGNCETDHDSTGFHGVLQQGIPFGIAAQYLVHNDNVRSWKFAHRCVPQLKLGSALKSIRLGQFGGSADHFRREVEPDSFTRPFL